jgi:putative tryptophan/tyrosine transport system substrate-binding protein
MRPRQFRSFLHALPIQSKQVWLTRSHGPPGVTGLSLQSTELSAKRLELIKQVVPGITHVGVLWESGSPQALAELHEIQQAAQSLKLRLQIEAVPSPDAFAPSISSIARQGAVAILFAGSPLFPASAPGIAGLSAD